VTAPVTAPVAAGDGGIVTETGHPAVDAVLQSLANAARLAPGEQIAEYEAAHQVLQETLASIDG
jgi:NADPH-dependent curcumin reductase CurA